jgi:hypothetical protein
MKKHNLSSDLKELLNTKDDLCVSLIIPQNEVPAKRKLDRIAIDHAIDKLELLLTKNYEVALVNQLIDKLKSVGEDLNAINGVKGLGLFVSKSLFKIVTFPFEVKEKIYAGTSFEIRDVLFRDHYHLPYFVLSLTLEQVRLFRGSGGTLSEINDNNFPASMAEPEAEVPDFVSGEINLTASTKREKTLTMESPQAFLNGVDKKLGMYFLNHEPLILAGVEKETAAYENITAHKTRIVGHVAGSYNGYNHKELSEKSWDCYQKHKLAEQTKTIGSLNELFGRELVSIGLPDVWRNAKLGKGNILVVEKDLSQAGYVTGDGYQLWLSPPAENHPVLSDAVDDLIETVLSMDGRVQFVDNGKLREFNGVAMIHRY